MGLGKQLRDERKKNNLSTEMLANICGVSRSYITLIENDKRLPSIKLLPKLALALNLKTNIVLNWYLENLRERMQENLKI
jgi:transcriptional regulator with XRE-family HTH domain